eukprot:TRINITY_DN6538_c1_g3_i2.p1 TRINITY_DN6538_c1_g3~~TRINITY_DN6538_c1_g3_i2.p1  ORF type:complete len:666 (+),score=136.11 TRINITY_DN6538_c1_g3_i2:103-2100(+)
MVTPTSTSSIIQKQYMHHPRPSLKTKPIDFQGYWEFLADAMTKVLMNPYKPATVSIEGFYYKVYKLCTSPSLDGGDEVREAQLYGKLKTFLIDHITNIVVPQVKGLPRTEILSGYLRQWENFRIGMGYIHSVFHYMNQEWVEKQANRPQSDRGNGDVHKVRTLGYICWKENLFVELRNPIIAALLDLIEQDRLGIPVDHGLLKGVIESIVSLGVNPRYPTDFYAKNFEEEFIRTTELFYEKEVQAKLNTPSNTNQMAILPEYMAHIEARLEQEQKRLVQYLDKSTEPVLMKALITVTIDAHIGRLLEASKEWFDNEQIVEQKRLFRLLEKTNGGLEPLRKLIEDRIDNEGKNSIMHVKNEAQRDPCAYVEVILRVYKKYAAMVTDIFLNHKHFNAALSKGCKRFINKNAIATTSGARSADLLAKYAHMLLKPSSKIAKARSEQELDDTLSEVLTIFVLLDDADVFQRVYRDMLSHRLIQNTYNTEQETIMIAKLKKVCGYEYTYKLQRMFTDIGISAELSKEYDEYLAKKELPNQKLLTVSILTSVSWPQTAQKSSFLPPDSISSCLTRFTQFYRGKYQGRSLSWLHSQSTGVLRATYTSRVCDLQVTTLQAAILMLYNSYSTFTLTYEEVADKTRIPQKEPEDPSKLEPLQTLRDISNRERQKN